MKQFSIGVKSIIIYNKKILLLQRSRNRSSGKGKGEWEFPGGKVDFGEDFHTTLHREIREETGLENIRIDKLLYAMTGVVNPELQTVALVYLCNANSNKVQLSDEHTDFVWADKKQLTGLLEDWMLDELAEHSILNSLEC